MRKGSRQVSASRRAVRAFRAGDQQQMLIVGAIIGLAGAVGLGKAAGSLLFGLTSMDPVVFALSLVVLMIVAFGAGYVPARRASQVDPIRALRYE